MPHLMSLVAAFLAVSVAVGVLAAGLMIPVVGALGSTSNKAITAFDNIDKTFSTTALSQQSRIVDANNKLSATPYDQNRIVVKLNKVAPIMQEAQIAIEDSRFYEHGALDIRGTARAFFNNAARKPTQGGSSLTQQYVKLTLQYEALKKGDEQAALDAIDVNYGRKLREMALAMQVEKQMTKKQILQGYLNLAYYGDQAYGIEAAALHFFNVHASELNLTQAATLAGVVQQPGTADPRNNPAAAQARRDTVLDRMVAVGKITPAEAAAAKKPSVKSLLRIRESEGGNCAKSPEPYFCNYVIAYLKTLPVLGKNVDERTLAITRGGLRIKTTLRSDWSQEMLKDLRSRVPAGDPSGVGAAAVVVEPGTGKVLAMAQTSEYGQTKDNRSTIGKTTQSWVVPKAYGGTLGFPIGSTAKVFTLLTALEHGYPVDGTVPAPKAGVGRSNAHVFPTNVYKDGCGSPDPWYVSNDYQTPGPTETFRNATAQSINTAFAATMISLGGCQVQEMWKRLGALDGDGKEVYPTPSNLVLGSGSMPPLTLANVYATLAANGKWCPVSPIESITTADGKKLKLPAVKCKQVIDKDVAAGADALLKGVITNGTGTTGIRGQAGFYKNAAGKTGTHEGHQQSWFVGYTTKLATAVYVGTPITAYEMTGSHACIGGRCYGNVFGGTIAAPLWGQIMNDITVGMPEESFPAPSSKIMYGDLVGVPSVIGMSVPNAIATLRAAGFSALEGGQTQSTLPYGVVAQTAPSGRAPRGSTIALLTSNGYVPPPPRTPSSSSTSSGPTTPTNTPTKPGNSPTKPTGTLTPRG